MSDFVTNLIALQLQLCMHVHAHGYIITQLTSLYVCAGIVQNELQKIHIAF